MTFESLWLNASVWLALPLVTFDSEAHIKSLAL